MRVKTLQIYLEILFEERKQSIIYLILNSCSELIYNLCIVYMPTIFLQFIFSQIEVLVILVYFIIFACSLIFKKIMYSKLAAEKEIQDQIMIMKIIDKMNHIPYFYLEDESIKKKRESCLYAIQNYGAVYDLYTKCIEIVSSLLTLLAIFTIIISHQAFYVIGLAILSILSGIINKKLINQKMKLSKKTIELNYLFGYFEEVAIQKKYQINHRLYHYADFVEKDFKHLNEETTKHFSKIREIEANYGSLNIMVSYLQSIIAYLFPILQLFAGLITAEQFTLLINCGNNISYNLDNLMVSSQNVMQSLDYLTPLYELMNLPDMNEKEGKRIFSSFETLEFKEVCFRYPNSESLILNHVNFKIKKNERAALMGLNGAGKTTIVKLILKLYEPESGVILLNGHNIQEYDDSYLSNISVVFQDCKVFPLTIKENIGASNIMENVYESCQRTSFDDVLNKKKITLDNLCDAEIYENGAEFSGGEKQLMAITRAVHRNGELIIMDEPSSALDPIMRNRLLLQYRSMTNHHTSLLITHDLTLAKQCDLILEIIQGEVIVHDRKSYAF